MYNKLERCVRATLKDRRWAETQETIAPFQGLRKTYGTQQRWGMPHRCAIAPLQGLVECLVYSSGRISPYPSLAHYTSLQMRYSIRRPTPMQRPLKALTHGRA